MLTEVCTVWHVAVSWVFWGFFLVSLSIARSDLGADLLGPLLLQRLASVSNVFLLWIIFLIDFKMFGNGLVTLPRWAATLSSLRLLWMSFFLGILLTKKLPVSRDLCFYRGGHTCWSSVHVEHLISRPWLLIPLNFFGSSKAVCSFSYTASAFWLSFFY